MAATTISDVSDLERAVNNNEVPQVDVFNLVNVIGKGDYCVAFRAHAGNPARPNYALLFARDPKYNQRVRDKGCTLQWYRQNPHLTRFILEGDYRGMPFLAQSYAQPLSRLLELSKAGWRASADDFALFLNDLLGALDFFHGQGYVHGDLHPGNVGFDILKQFWLKVKLLDVDFTSGTALSPGLISGQRCASGISGEGETAYLYAAPEVCEGNAVTPSSDIYSAGALGFALLIGRSPQRGEYDVRELRPELPKWTSSALASMIQGNMRRPSALLMQEWLHEYVEADERRGKG